MIPNLLIQCKLWHILISCICLTYEKRYVIEFMVKQNVYSNWPWRIILDTAWVEPQHSVVNAKVYVPKSSSVGGIIVSGKLVPINTPSLKTWGTGSDPLNILHWIIIENTGSKLVISASCPHVIDIKVGVTIGGPAGGNKFGSPEKHSP